MGTGKIRYNMVESSLKLMPIVEPILDFVEKLPFSHALSPLNLAFRRKYFSVSFVPVNKNIELGESMYLPLEVAENIIRKSSYHVILNHCPDRYMRKCEKYPRDFGCLFMGEAAREIDPAVGRHVTVDEAITHARESVELGLPPVVGKFRLDALLIGVPWKKLMTMCFCCPCCCIGNTVYYGSRKARDLVVKMEGVEVKVTDECSGCGICADICFLHQITIENKRARIGEECKACGRCASACPKDAIKVIVNVPGYVEMATDRISGLVSGFGECP